jgi:hypothetical protein
MPPQTATRVLLVTNGNRYLEAALLLDTSHAVSVISPEQYRDAIGYDVVVFDRYAPETPPGVPSLFIAAPANPRDFPLRVLGSVERPRVEQTLHDHPLLRQVALRDVNIAKAGRLVLQAGDRAIAGAKTTPLIVTGIRAEQAFVAIGFDVRESDLPLRVAWPVLLTHVLDFLHPPDVEYLPALEVGIQQLVPVAETESHISVRTPLGTRESLAMEPSGRGVWLRPLQAGFYRLESQAETRVRAANRQALRSVSIAPQPLRGVRTTRPAGAHSPWNSEAWVLLLGLAWLVAFVEWLTYQRRWTV